MNDTTLDLFESKADEEQLKATQLKSAYAICEAFADLHELPVDYVWAEFADPEKVPLSEVIRVLQ